MAERDFVNDNVPEITKKEHTRKNVGAKRIVVYAYDADTDNLVAIKPVSNGDGTYSMSSQITALPTDTYSATAMDVSSSGDNTIVAITNTARLYYVSLSANGANPADVTAVVSIGASEKYKVSLKAGSIWARNIGAGRRYLTGSAGDDIIVNLSDAQTVHVSVEYEDI